jgi:hypothetical protein
MKLPLNVKPKGFLSNIFPFSKYTAQAIYPNIYFQRGVYDNLKSEKPNPVYVAALKHEQTHIERQKKTGPLMWGLKYIFSPDFRFNEELEAIKATIKYYKKEKINFGIDRRAKLLSGWLYLWCVSYKRAKEVLDEAWKEA